MARDDLFAVAAGKEPEPTESNAPEVARASNLAGAVEFADVIRVGLGTARSEYQNCAGQSGQREFSSESGVFHSVLFYLQEPLDTDGDPSSRHRFGLQDIFYLNS
jgi:hypothetical protein